MTATGDIRIAALRGEIDLVAVARITPAINDTIRSPAGTVIMDLTEVTLMDSAGLAMLMNALRRLERADRRLLVVCAAGPVRRTLEIAAISGLLELHETRAAAVDAAGEDVR